MTRTITRLALATALAFPAALAAQTPTPENTTITNTATASWTDANGNTYTSVTASATVTVGYLVSFDVASPATATPPSPSPVNYQAFTIANGGNGTDSVTVTPSVGTGASITGYRIGATTYATLADLNLALSGIAIAAGSSITVEIQYSVAAGQGGQTIPLTLSATSRRRAAVPAGTDASTTNLQPAVAAAVAVTPDAGTFDRVPTNAAAPYTQDFVVTNNGNKSDTFTLVSSTGSGLGTTVAIVSTNGTAGASSSVTIAPGATATITVAYTVGNVAANTTDLLRLVATSGNDNTKSDPGSVTVRVVRAALAISKAAYRDDQTAAIGAGLVLPGEFIQYKISVTNTGAAAASNVVISDPLAGQLTYVSITGDAAGWTMTTPGGVPTATLGTPLAAGATRYVWIRAQVK